MISRCLWIGAALGQMALIWWLSSRSGDAFGELPFPHADKVVHFGLFGALGLFWSLGLPAGRHIATALIITLVWAGLDEWHQSWVPGRTADLVDWLFDALGASVAVSAGACLRGSD